MADGKSGIQVLPSLCDQGRIIVLRRLNLPRLRLGFAIREERIYLPIVVELDIDLGRPLRIVNPTPLATEGFSLAGSSSDPRNKVKNSLALSTASEEGGKAE